MISRYRQRSLHSSWAWATRIARPLLRSLVAEATSRPVIKAAPYLK
jgi:hypothetical protein